MSDADPDDPWLVSLGEAVSDGTPVDWDTLSRDAPNAARRDAIAQLRTIARLAELYRDTVADGAPADAPAAVPQDAAGERWHGLLLFDVIGAGAFGKVYRGRDEQLQRDVAVKILSRAFGDVASPLAEARHLARVRHPNVVTVYGADQDEGRAGLWMEYIKGRTLADLVRENGPLSPRETTGIGLDLSHAVSALHGSGLLHRDIKAQNVMREVGGRIVLMDFSGAHALSAHADARRFSGTPLFMAPELFADGAATPASDIYSLGVLLFFLLTAAYPVTGQTIEDVKAAHAAGTRTRLRDLRPDLPDGIVQVIERMTAPDPAMRFQTAGDVEDALVASSGLRRPAAEPPSPRRGWWAAAVLAVVTAGFAVATLWPRAAEPRPVRFTIGPPYMTGSWPRLSAQGTVAFGVSDEGQSRLWIRRLDAVQGRSLPGTSARETPFWSPDGTQLAFFADGKLKTLAIDRGEPQVVTDAPSPHGGAWSETCILFAIDSGIQRVAPDGTHLAPVTRVDPAQGDRQHGWPEFLPDGNRFLYIIRSSKPERTGLYLGSLDGSVNVRLMDAYSRTAFSQGHILYVRDGTLQAQPFDPDHGLVRGPAVPLAPGVKFHARTDAAFDATPSGVLVYATEPGLTSTQLRLYDRRGRELRAVTPVPGAYRMPRFSPDGRRIVAEKGEATEATTRLWVYDLERAGETQVTGGPDPTVNPAWSPDGSRIAFSSRRNGRFEIFSKFVDGTATPAPLAALGGDTLIEDWSRDGRYLSAAVRGSGLWVVPLDPAAKPWRVRADVRSNLWQSEFSPDSKWLAYMSEESGRAEVYVEPVPATGRRWQISMRGGGEPHWRADGKEFFYLNADATLVALTVTPREWQRSAPTLLFRTAVADIADKPDYSVSPDGQRVVVNAFVADPPVPPLDVVVNWTALLRR